MTKNFIDYTGMTYDDIKKSIVARMSQDSRFETFKESSMYAVLTEIFAATTDFTNYYLERRAEESYLDSAKLRSSIIMLSKMLGYIIRRPIPASTNIKIVLKTLPPSVKVGDRIEIKQFSTFTHEGQTLLLKDFLTYVVTQTDINNFADPSYFKEFKQYYIDDARYGELVDDELVDGLTSPITLIQAEQRTYSVNANTNEQINKRFQTYKINDKEFSNIFGSEDYGYDFNSADPYSVIDNMTRVGIGSTEDSAFALTEEEFNSGLKEEFLIDRRSFLNETSIPMLSAYNAGQNTRFCVVRTSMNDGVELLFGDDNVSKIGAKSGQNIYVRYLATKGSAGNKTGVIGKTIDYQGTEFGSIFVKNNLQFFLNSNITGGADIENIDSIKLNTPEIFYSLERCVTPRDYASFLKTQVLSTKIAKNAIAWGEQEETRDSNVIANIKLFNVVLFCALSDLYKKANDVTYGQIYTDIDSSSDPFLAPLSASQFNWYDTIVLSDSTTPLKNIKSEASDYPDLKRIYDKLYTRSQLTVKNVYIAPIVHDFEIKGNIYLNPLVNKLDVYKRITNELYTFLSDNADFNVPVYKSNIIDIIQNYPEVSHANVYLSPTVIADSDTFNTMYMRSLGSEVSADYAPTFSTDAIGTIYNSSITGPDKFGTREYSDPSLKRSTDIMLYSLTSDATIWSKISAYNPNTLSAISCLLPGLEVKTFKEDANYVTSTLIWPSTDEYSSKYCGVPARIPGDVVVENYTPSERNLFLGMIQCFANQLKKLATRDYPSSTALDLIKSYDELLNSQKICFCSLRSLKKTSDVVSNIASCQTYFDNANATEVQDFIDNVLPDFVTLLDNTFNLDIKKGLMDSYGNISNYSMKNEIVRVKAPALSQYIYT